MCTLLAVVATNVLPQSSSVTHPGLSSVVTFIIIIHCIGFVYSPAPYSVGFPSLSCKGNCLSLVIQLLSRSLSAHVQHLLFVHCSTLYSLGVSLSIFVEAIVYQQLSLSILITDSRILRTLSLYGPPVTHEQHLPFVHSSTLQSIGFPSLSCGGNSITNYFFISIAESHNLFSTN